MCVIISILKKIGEKLFMPRFANIFKWKPERTPEVLKRWATFIKGERPDVLEAHKRLNYITWEFGSAYGQTVSVVVVEGDLADISTVNRDWWDLGTFEILPCVHFDTLLKWYPDRVIHTLNP